MAEKTAAVLQIHPIQKPIAINISSWEFWKESRTQKVYYQNVIFDFWKFNRYNFPVFPSRGSKCTKLYYCYNSNYKNFQIPTVLSFYTSCLWNVSCSHFPIIFESFN